MARGDALTDIIGRAKAIAALIALLKHGPLGQTLLEERIGAWSGQVRPLVERFEKNGLVIVTKKKTRVFSPITREISLTSKGRTLAELLDKAVQAYPDAEHIPDETTRGATPIDPLPHPEDEARSSLLRGVANKMHEDRTGIKKRNEDEVREKEPERPSKKRAK